MSGYKIEIDRQKNRLYLTLEGMMNEETAREHVRELVDAADDLEDGFDMVNDIREFKPFSQEVTDVIEEGKQGLTDNGVSAVVRVTGDSSIGALQFTRVGSEEQGYQARTAETVAEAEALLDRLREQSA